MSSRAKISNAGVLSLVAAAVLARFRLVTETASGADYIDNVADLPKGITLDGVDAIGDNAALALLGKGDTKILKMAGTGSRGDRICPSVDSSGTGRAIPATAGLEVYIIGYADEDWAADQEIAVLDCVPYLHRNPAATIADAATTATAPVAVTGVALTGTVTGTANGVLEDIAAAAGACAGSATPAASDVDTAIATAVAPIVTGLNLQVKELMTIVNALIVDIAAIRTRQGTEITDIGTLTTKANAILAALEAAAINAAA